MRRPRPEWDDETHAIAVHEAGHAVACLAVGGRFDFVTIVPDEFSLGRLVHSPDQKRDLPDDRQALVSLAGTIAVDLWFRSGWIHRGPHYPDWAAARFLLSPENQPTAPPEPNPELDALWARHPNALPAIAWSVAILDMTAEDQAETTARVAAAARAVEKLLRRQWAKVERLAAALVERNTLTSDQVRQIIHEPTKGT